MIEDQQQRELKRQQLLEQQKKNDDETAMKSVMLSSRMTNKTRTHDEFMADQIKFEQQRFEKLRNALEREEEESSVMYKP